MARLQAPLLAVAIIAAAAAAFATTAYGASYTVGEPGGSWDLQTNFTAWASSIDFHSGDQLVFKYSAAAHDVVEVSRSGYLSCSPASPVSMSRAGSTTVLLTSESTRYFICGVPGHCDGGMKLQVTVVPPTPGCNNSPPPPPPRLRRRRRRSGAAEATNGTPGGVCLGDSPTAIITPGSTSYGSAPGSSGSVSSVVLAIMVLLVGLIL